MSWFFPVGSYFRYAMPAAFTFTDQFTILALFQRDAAEDDVVIHRYDGSGAFAGFGLDIGQVTNNRVAFWCGGSTWIEGATDVTISKPHLIGASLKGTAVSIYLDGRVDGTGTQTADLNATAQDLYFARNAADGINRDVTIQWAAIWNRVLAPHEHIDLLNGRSPEDFPQGLRFYFDSVGCCERVFGIQPTITGTPVMQPDLCKQWRKARRLFIPVDAGGASPVGNVLSGKVLRPLVFGRVV